jgi:hypothetical protein
MTRAIIMQGNPCTVLARVIGGDGNAITSADIATVAWTVYDVDAQQQTDTGSPDVDDCIYDTLQTDGRWTTDSIGFNLAVDIDDTAFPVGGDCYQVRITLTPVSGDPYSVVAMIQTREVYQ